MDRVAVVGKDCLHQGLSDVVDVTVDRRQNDRALRDTLDAFEIGLHARDGLLHDFSRLQDVRKDALPCPKLITDLLHCWKQDSVQDVDRCIVATRPMRGAFGNRRVYEVFNPVLAPLQDPVPDPFISSVGFNDSWAGLSWAGISTA